MEKVYMEFNELKAQYFEMEPEAAENKIICNATYEQINNWKFPHYGGEAVMIYMGAVKVGEIIFYPDDTEKMKKLEVDLTPHISPDTIYTTLILRVMVDNNLFFKGTRTRATFSLTVKGKRILQKTFETDLPAYSSQHNWPIAKP